MCSFADSFNVTTGREIVLAITAMRFRLTHFLQCQDRKRINLTLNICHTYSEKEEEEEMAKRGATDANLTTGVDMSRPAKKTAHFKSSTKHELITGESDESLLIQHRSASTQQVAQSYGLAGYCCL